MTMGVIFQYNIIHDRKWLIGSRGYKTFFMLNSAEHNDYMEGSESATIK